MPKSDVESRVEVARKPVEVAELPTESPPKPKDHSDTASPRMLAQGLWIDGIGIAICSIGLVASREFWGRWLASSDQLLFTAIGCAGLMISVGRSFLWKSRGPIRLKTGVALLMMAAIVALLGFIPNGAIAGAVAVGMGLGAWSILRFPGEAISHGIFVGMLAILPVLWHRMQQAGILDGVEPLVVQSLSDMSDFMVFPHVREGNTIAFGYGTADYFRVTGAWDGLMGLVGVWGFLTLLFRRRLVSGALTLLSTPFVWIAVRTLVWTALVMMSSGNEQWHEWTFAVGVVGFSAACLMMLGLDLFYSAIFSPIPFEYISTDFPLFAILWNWICGLPELTSYAPIQDSDFVPFEVEAGSHESLSV